MKIPARKFFVLVALCVAAHGGAVTLTIAPSAVSNTYLGPITLQISGLTNAETVVVQKFLDANADGAVDAPDLLVQQFNLTDGQAGMVIGGVTNLNVPGDTDGAANGTITARLNFPDLDFVQNVVGQFIFRVSSPVGHFAAVSATFDVTNFPFAQTISGTVVSNSVPVANAVIVLFPPPRAGDHGPGNPVGGGVADGSGVYSVRVPPGTYVPMAFKPNYVANYAGSPLVTLTNGQTVVTNLSLAGATAAISGRVVDANNGSLGLPGVFLPAINQSGLIGIGFTDTNGYFSIGVQSGGWGISGGAAGSLNDLGYVSYNGSTNVNAGTTGLVLPVYPATALFYGTVKDGSGNPLAGVTIEASDNNNLFTADGLSNTNGNYVVAVLGGLNGDSWQVYEANGGNHSGPANYIYSSGQNGIMLSAGQAYHYNFTGLLATNYLSGHVQFNGSPVVGVRVYADATIGGNVYQNQADTDASGNYSFNVANGSWTVNVYDCGCSDSDDSLNNILSSETYQDPSPQNVVVANNNQMVNFTIPPPGGGMGQIYGYVTDTNLNPIAGIGVYASNGLGNNYSATTDGNGYYAMNSVVNGSYTVSVDCGQLNTEGYSCANNDVASVSGNSVEANFAVQFIGGPPVVFAPAHLANGSFQMTVGGYAGHNYTVQMTTNLASTNWIPLLVTNPVNGSFLFQDGSATNPARYYRVWLGP
jgi:hypothetical protein